jgi:predicted DNA-binding transcriptional regulator YafY
MSETAIARAVRTFDLIPYILNNPGVSIRELSEEFGVAERQITEDLRIVFMCGLPGYTPYELIELQVSDGYVTVRDPQVLDKPRTFSAEEQLALSLGLQMIENYTSNLQTKLTISNLIKKLNISNILNLAKVNTENSDAQKELISEISHGIRNKAALKITYISKMTGATSEREIFPFRIYFEGGAGYVEAYCLKSLANRNFALANIEKIEKSEIKMTNKIESQIDEQVVTLGLAADMQLFIEQINAVKIKSFR